MSEPKSEVTSLLQEWRNGQRQALDQLMAIVYEELRRLAASHLRRESSGHLLQPTALVNEAYLRLMDQTHAHWQNKAQFFSVASQLMRRILVDYARDQRAIKRGSGEIQQALQEALHVPAASPASEVLALDDALTTLARLNERQARIVELRYFGGLEIAEVAALLQLSPATVKRDWVAAKAWLYTQLKRT